jgi:hypothetical protein
MTYTSEQIKAMDNDTLRAEIARARGYIDHGVMNDGAHEFYLPNGDPDQYFYINGRYSCDVELPNWPQSIAAAWELVEEAHIVVIPIETTDEITAWCAEADMQKHSEPHAGDWYEKPLDNPATAPTAPRAIAEAYLLWKQG